MESCFIPQDVWQVQTDTERHKSSLMHFAYFHSHRPWRDSLHIIFKWRQRGQLITQKWKSQAQMSLSFVFHLECADRPHGRHRGDEVTVSEQKWYGLFAAFQVMSVMFAYKIVLSVSVLQLLQVRVDGCIRPGVVLFYFLHHFYRGQHLDIKKQTKINRLRWPFVRTYVEMLKHPLKHHWCIIEMSIWYVS